MSWFLKLPEGLIRIKEIIVKVPSHNTIVPDLLYFWTTLDLIVQLFWGAFRRTT